jgi:hypothetical protein
MASRYKEIDMSLKPPEDEYTDDEFEEVIVAGQKATKRYAFHEDPGHGWLEVTRQDLIDLGIDQDVSPYSYQNGQNVFLEEDCDMTLFFKAYEKKFGEKPETMYFYEENTPIRRYQHYQRR